MLLAWFGGALALTLGSMSERFNLVEKIWPAVALILFPLSGAAFMVDALPPQAQNILLYLPMLHGVEYLREGFFGSQINAHYDIAYLIIANTLLTLFGLSQVKRVVLGESTEF
jgi:ABC-2 type transport system permease protein/capsular polysaccharide transport system permease protein